MMNGNIAVVFLPWNRVLAIVLMIVVVIVVSVYHPLQWILLGTLLYGICVLMTFRFPAVPIFVFIMQYVLESVKLGDVSGFVMLGLVTRLVDPIYGAILLYLCVQIVQNTRIVKRFVREYTAFCFLLLYVALNILYHMVAVYGRESLKEGREYLQLIMVPYVALMGHDEKTRKLFLRFILGGSFLALAVYIINYVGITLGLATAGDAGIYGLPRSLKADLSLGVLLAVVGVIVGAKHNVFRGHRRGLYALALVGCIEIFLDAHRSVWLASVLVIFTLFFLGEMRQRKTHRVLLWIGSFAAASAFISAVAQIDLLSFLSERITAIVDAPNDPNAYWRLLIWAEGLTQFLSNPIFGSGFGSYFYFEIPPFGVYSVVPHNLYLELLMKVGIIGFLAYLFSAKKFWDTFRAWRSKAMGEVDRAILTLGITTLVGMHAFFVAYGFDALSWLYVGLASSVVVSQHRQQSILS